MGFTFTRDRSRDFVAGSVRIGDNRLSFAHGGDRYGRHYNHWVFGGKDCRYGYRYPYYGYYGYGYPRYRNYSPYYQPYYLPYWYYAPTFGYSYVSAYYVPTVSTYTETYGSAYGADSYYAEPYSGDGGDSVVIYGAENVYVDGDPYSADSPAHGGTSYPAGRSYEPAPFQGNPDRDPTHVRPNDLTPESAAPAQSSEWADQDRTAEGTEDGWGEVLDEGNAAFAAGNYAEAMRYYTRAITADPTNGYAMMLHAWAAFADRNVGEAAQLIRQAVSVTPDLIGYPIDIRVLYGDQQVFIRQLTDLRNMVLARPQDIDATFVLAYAHYSIGEPDKAASLFKTLAVADPNDDLYGKLAKAAERGQEILRTREQNPPAGAPSQRQ